jgi:thiamine-phosphate diphosphorylase
MLTVVTDRKLSVFPFEKQIESVISAEPDRLVLREKDLSETEFRRLAVFCGDLCRDHGVEFRINSFLSVARELNVKSVQLPMPLFEKQNGFSADMSVGVSVHCMKEAVYAESHGASDLIFGNIFETGCKPGKGAAGTALLKDVCDSVNIPVYAIGGLTPDNVSILKGTGVSGICVMSSAMKSPCPRDLFERLRRGL